MMSHHIACQIGSADAYVPRTRKSDGVYRIAIDKAGDPQGVRNTVTEELQRYHLSPPRAAMDLLALAMAVYSADMGIRRSTGYDSWTRHLILHLPVFDPGRWKRAQPVAEEMLRFLTGDHWELRLRRRAARGTIASAKTPELFTEKPNAVSLLSGGLDSFAGAIERLEIDEHIAFVGHYGAGSTHSAQQSAYGALEKAYPHKSAFLPFYVQHPPPFVQNDPERTTRSRSILFLALGTAVASGIGKRIPLFVPENGLISLNPPLTHARMGSASTRTTHPHVLCKFREILDALKIETDVEAPYRLLTKGEMLEAVSKNKAFLAGVHKTQSCSHPDVGRYAGESPGQHCGYCVPCIIRRAALARVGLDDPRQYLFDIRKTKGSKGTERAGRDLKAFQMAIERLESASRARLLFDVLDTGPIPPEEVSDLVEVYGNGIAELRAFLRPAKVHA